MSKKRNMPRPPADGGEALENEVHQALLSLGWLPPECEDDVQRADAELPAADLPEPLRDPATVFDDKAGQAGRVIPFAFGSDAQIEEHLARAARNGGAIPPEIEERMRRDREEAEKQQYQADNGQDIR